ncbi:protein arginine N-methyltransferase 5-like isoform X2 [Sitodiplosis mosellana]|uniref:protein arginine N-methyltransferase 5-like isoform X2 n=1 Tax=Sitodiplosis mosellana TaxID=263140 RepID=UPI002444913C|nr:protein arginine N-methyltransferase 5-like isoform X2 [Sitodiplosis mosellana]
MFRSEPLICLYLDNVPDIQKAINMGKKTTYDRIVLRVATPQSGQRGNDKNGNKIKPFTRSDLLLSGEEWRRNTILKVGEFGDCESRCKHVQKQSIRNLNEEINWAKHLDSIVCVTITLYNDESFNMARQLLEKFDQGGCVLAEMTIVDKSFFTQNYSKDEKTIKQSQASTMVWQRWNKFRLSIDFDKYFKIALELTPTMPNECELRRWFAEPVELIIIPSNMFELSNNNNQISLKECYRYVCQEFWNHTSASFAVRCTYDDPWIDNYPKILRSALAVNRFNGVKHECNYFSGFGLKLPLTPDDHINKCAKYHEKMHNVYAKAIRLAIEDRLQINDKVRLMICGANGWKLLEPVMAIIDNSKTVEVFVFDEDPCARISIKEAIEHLYADRNTKITILADANAEEYFAEMDIVVSITSRAIYESQCLQFNFNRVHEYIRPDAIFIPGQSSISIVPITCALAYSTLHEGALKFNHRNSAHELQSYEIRAQIVCPLYTRNFYECADAHELFSFKYQCSYNDRSIRVTTDSRTKRSEFVLDREAVVTGFAGYFQAVMYKDVTLNNRTMFNNHNIGCIPMAYFPLKCPQTLSAQEKLKTAFWLHINADKQECWYEWHTMAPIPTSFQNLKGDSYTLRHS